MKKGYLFPVCMAILVLISGGISIFAQNAEGVWIFTLLCALLGGGNAVRNKLKFGVWFTEQAS